MSLSVNNMLGGGGSIKIENGTLNEYYSKSGSIPKNNFISIDESASVSEIELYNAYEKGSNNFNKYTSTAKPVKMAENIWVTFYSSSSISVLKVIGSTCTVLLSNVYVGGLNPFSATRIDANKLLISSYDNYLLVVTFSNEYSSATYGTKVSVGGTYSLCETPDSDGRISCYRSNNSSYYSGHITVSGDVPTLSLENNNISHNNTTPIIYNLMKYKDCYYAIGKKTTNSPYYYYYLVKIDSTLNLSTVMTLHSSASYELSSNDGEQSFPYIRYGRINFSNSFYSSSSSTDTGTYCFVVELDDLICKSYMSVSGVLPYGIISLKNGNIGYKYNGSGAFYIMYSMNDDPFNKGTKILTTVNNFYNSLNRKQFLLGDTLVICAEKKNTTSQQRYAYMYPLTTNYKIVLGGSDGVLISDATTTIKGKVYEYV